MNADQNRDADGDSCTECVYMQRVQTHTVNLHVIDSVCYNHIIRRKISSGFTEKSRSVEKKTSTYRKTPQTCETQAHTGNITKYIKHN